MKRLIVIFIAVILPLATIRGAADGRFRSATPAGGKITSVFAIAQEGDGPLWMGTDDGLLRYDGYDWRQIRHTSGDSLSLPDNIVGTLAYDSERRLLIAGTDSGLCLYDPSKDCLRIVGGSRHLHIKSVLPQGDSIWAATTTGLYLFSDGAAEKLLEGHFTSVRKIYGSIWAASAGCLMEQPAGSALWTRHPIGGESGLVLDICPDAEGGGNLWVGSESGLCLYSPRLGQCLEHLLENTPIKTFRYHGSTLWMGTDNGAATLESDGRIVFYRHDVSDPQSIPNNVVWAVAEDTAGNLWFGTDHGAASAFTGRPYRFTRIDRITGSTDGMDIGVMAPGSDGSLWIGGRGGLRRWLPPLDCLRWRAGLLRLLQRQDCKLPHSGANRALQSQLDVCNSGGRQRTPLPGNLRRRPIHYGKAAATRGSGHRHELPPLKPNLNPRPQKRHNPRPDIPQRPSICHL